MSYEHKDRSGYFYTKQALGKGMKFKHLLMPLLFKIDIHFIYWTLGLPVRVLSNHSFPSVRLSVRLLVCPSVGLSVRWSVRPLVHPSVRL